MRKLPKYFDDPTSRMRFERVRLGLSQKDWANRAYMSLRKVRALEKGDDPSWDVLLVLSALVTAGADPLFILTGVRNEHASAKEALAKLSRDERQRVLLELVAEEMKA